MKLSETIRELIRLGTTSREYWEKELPLHHPHYPVVRAGEISPPPPPEDAEIRTLLEDLSEEQLYTILVIAFAGRGNYSAERLQSAYGSMKEAFPSKDLLIAKISGEPWLADDLTDGMEDLQERHIDVDTVDFASVPSAP